ncbi:MAG TPA: tetratricopeptide repeat protein [Bacillota bacterium]|nr:tetratricopeptide repeat protein [Bacillota bacterium]
MKPKIDIADSLGERTYLANDACQTRLDADKTQLAAEGYHTVLVMQPQSVTAEAAAAEENQELYRIGDYIGDRYEVLTIHRGAWGVVYGTYDHEEELPRALKTIQKRYRFDKKLLGLFTEEAALWVSLEKHPYIARAYNVEKFEEQPFVITEYISNPQGNDLRSWLGSPKLTLAIGVELALKIAQGMQYARRKVAGLVHRDLKPANILVDEYAQPYITDFGLVHAAGSDAGTPAYMAPEQWRKEPVTVQTDIYAFGCILYEILTGHRMFTATAVDEWRYMHLMQFPVPPSGFKPEIPAGLEEFVLKCLEKDPDRRLRNWDEMVEVLAGWCYQLTGVPPVMDFSAYKLDARELLLASCSIFSLKKNPEALAIIERVLGIDPEWAIAWYMKSLILQELGRGQEALDWLNSCSEPDGYYLPLARAIQLSALERDEEALIGFDQLLETEPEDETLLRHKGLSLRRLKRFREALEYYNQILERDPNNYEFWWSKIKTLEELEEYEEALVWCEKYVEAKPRDYDGWFEKGYILTHLYRLDEALVWYHRYLEVHPVDATAWFNIGNNLGILKRYPEAIECFDKAIAIEPDKWKAWREKATILYKLERHREALDCLKRALEFNPVDDEAWYKRGLVLFRLEKYAEVISDCDRALEINLHNVDAWVCKLRALGKSAGWEETLSQYNRALELCPDGWELWTEKGRVLNDLGRYGEALPYLDRALELRSDEYFPWLRKGIALFYLDNYKEALSCCDRALGLNTFDETSLVWYYKGLILDKLGRYGEATQAFEQAMKLDPEEAEYFSSLARSLYHFGRYEEAVAYGDRALAIEPKNTWGLEYKGKCLIMLGYTAEGTAYLKKLLEIDPELDIWDDFSEKIAL